MEVPHFLELKQVIDQMRNYILTVAMLSYGYLQAQDSLKMIRLEEISVYSTRANDKTPTTHSTISKEELSKRNLGQDLPILLNLTPSLVTTSDAGAGIGYTGMRIRGSDATRINVTVNGIPLNDSESHGVFWVNMPDFASSVNSIQIQRGVGTSSNGTAAFGATVNLQTHTVSPETFVQFDNSYGSFNTWKSNVTYNSGLLNGTYNFETRLSKISSDGYIDRAAADLKSYYVSGGRFGKKTMIKMVLFGGQEITHQAWYGTPEARLNGKATELQNVIDFGGEYDSQEQVDNLQNSNRRFNYYLYDNEIDNYQQDHYQLHIGHTFSESFNFSGALHYTKGRGYFEQLKTGENLADYGIQEVVIGTDTITRSDIIRRRWLANDFYGAIYAVNYDRNKVAVSFGGGYNNYEGDHFGEIIWAEFAGNAQIREHYYDGNGAKTDFNSYLKINYQLTEPLNLFGDAQIRAIKYETSGLDSDRKTYDVNASYAFFNPKLGLTYSFNGKNDFYVSYAVGNREPVRSDFIEASSGATPKPETLRNVEVGMRSRGNGFSYSVNYYLMNYKNQLVLTGAVNDVGAPIRINVPKSYRMGVEVVGSYQLSPAVLWSANVAFSHNKIERFTEVVFDYGAAFDEYNVVEIDHENSNISFSPNVVAGSDLSFSLTDAFTLQLLTKFVGKQYLDNTSNDDRAIESYLTNDIRIAYEFVFGGIKRMGLSLLVNNILNEKYSSNGYTWGYFYGQDLYQQNNYYPQAGTNFLMGLSVKF